MKIEIDTNKDSDADWSEIQKLVGEIYRVRKENRKKPVVIKPDRELSEDK